MQLAPKLWFAFAMSALGLLGSVAVPACFISLTGKDANFVVPLTVLALGGVLALISILALVAATFSALNLTDSSQALGLPEGTIRAVIALSLIMIFVISALFLFGRLADKEHPISQEGADFAKQVLTTVSTLVVAISSFYFGARSVQSAVSPVQASQPDESGDDSGPKIDQLDPNTIQPPASQLDQTIVVTGKNLSDVSAATLVGPDNAGKNDVTQLSATKLVPEANKLTCVFTVPSNIAIGDWKLLLETKEGVKLEKERALNVSSPT
jgi:uncharacterized membrane protein (DUF485 family)